jgi:hypothetical protein
VASHLAVSFWRTSSFALLALVLGAFIYFVERPRMQSETDPGSVLLFEPDEISAISLRYPGAPDIVLTKTENAWRLQQPIEFSADSTTVSNLLTQIAGTKSERRIDLSDAEPLSVYGLDGDGAHARVTLSDANGEQMPALIVGNTTPVGYSAFARVESKDEILITPLLLHTGVRKTLLEFRDKRVFDIEESAAIAIDISSATRSLRLERRGDDWFIVGDTGDIRGDTDQARALVSALNTIQALEFFDTPVESGDGTDAPTLAVHVELGGGGNAGFRLGNGVGGPGSGYYLRRDQDGLVVKVDDNVRVRFDKTRSDLRDKHLFRCAGEQIGEIRFDRADGAGFALSRADAEWRLVLSSAEEGGVRSSVAERTVSGLLALAGNEIASESELTDADLQPFGLNPPTVEVEVFSSDGSSCGRAVAGVTANESGSPAYYVKRRDEDVIMTLPGYLFSRLDVRREDLIEKAPGSEASPSP